MTIRIRPAEPRDFDAIAELSVRAYAADGQLAHGVEGHYAARLRDVAGRARDTELLVAVDVDETVLGSVAMCLPGSAYAEVCGESELEFRMLAVDPAAQGRGVGRALAEACVARAVEMRRSAVVICTRDDTASAAQKLYASMGFVRLPERDWKPLPDVSLIAWTLAL